MSYHPPDTKNEIDELNKKIGVLRNITRTASVGINLDTSAFGVGSGSAVNGKNHGVQYYTPQVHTVSVDGSSRRHINLTSAVVIVDEAGTSALTLHYIDGTFNDGQYIIIRPLAGKTLVLKKATTLDATTGNLYLDSDITLNENDFFTLVFMKDLGTGGGMYAQELGSTGGGGANWSAIVIDSVGISKDMRQGLLTDVNTLSFDTSSGASSKQIFQNSAGINYNVPNGVQHGFFVNGFLVLGMNGTQINSSITLDMGNNTIQNINTLSFHSSTATKPFITSDGNDKVINASIRGFDILELSNSFDSGSGIPDNGILEIIGSSHGTHAGNVWIPAFKTFNTSSVLSPGDPVGGVYFDATNSALVQKTFANIITKAVSPTSGSEQGMLSFQVMSTGVISDIVNIDGGGLHGTTADFSGGLELFAGSLIMDDGVNMFVGSTTGTKLGLSSSQKLGFWGKTPVIKQTVSGSRGSGVALQNLLSVLNTMGLINDSSTP